MALTQVQPGMLGTPQPYNFKNRIINGAMVIDQRNAGASVTPTNGQFLVDRWSYYGSQASKFTAQQNQGSVTLPAGFIKYLGFTSSSAYSSTATDYFLFQQGIEGFNAADLAWGTANAKTVTLSFQVYSSLTGTFGGVLMNTSNTRCYPFTYTVSSANTWTAVSVTVAGCTDGVWPSDNTGGIYVVYDLGCGSNYRGAAGAWSTSNLRGATGTVSVVGTNGATFYITGVQLEVGVSATGFDYRPYGTELQLCQRYYESSYPLGYAPGYNFGEQYPFGTAQPACLNLIASDDTLTSGTAYFKVPKRASPSTIIYSPNNGSTNYTWSYRAAGAGNVAVSVPISQPNFVTFTQSLGAVDKANESYFLFVASAEL